MLFSISLILLVGMAMGWAFNKFKLPSLIGMLLTGIILGPFVLNLIDESILTISSELRKIALIIILTRAGLGLDFTGLKKIGRPALLMCFLPATFELIGIIIVAPKLMGLSFPEACVLGAVLAAVSPAVVVPRMVKLMDEGYGVKQGIPQLILAGASVDDVYVIVLFSTFVSMMQGENASVVSFVNIPVSIVLGILIGFVIGCLLALFFKKVHIRDTSKVIIILSISLLLTVAEDNLKTKKKEISTNPNSNVLVDDLNLAQFVRVAFGMDAPQVYPKEPEDVELSGIDKMLLTRLLYRPILIKYIPKILEDYGEIRYLKDIKEILEHKGLWGIKESLGQSYVLSLIEFVRKSVSSEKFEEFLFNQVFSYMQL